MIRFLNQFLVCYSYFIFPLLFNHSLATIATVAITNKDTSASMTTKLEITTTNSVNMTTKSVNMTTKSVNMTTKFANMTKKEDLKFWVRDPKFEKKKTVSSLFTSQPTPTLPPKDNSLLEQVISQSRGNHSAVLENLKALRRSGVSLDSLFSELDDLEHYVQKVDGIIDEKNGLKRKHLDGGNLLHKYEKEKHNKNKERNEWGRNSKHLRKITKSNKTNITRFASPKHNVRHSNMKYKSHEKKPQKNKSIERSQKPRNVLEVLHKDRKHTIKSPKAENTSSTSPKSHQRSKELYEGSWPRVKPIMSTHSHLRSNNVRVTKMDPLLLRQQTQKVEEEKDSKQEVEDPKKPLVTLNPYNIKKQLRTLCIKNCAFPNTNISIHLLGRTVEYNEIVMLKVTEKDENKKERYLRTRDEEKYIEEEPEKKIVFIVHGLSPMGINRIPCLSILKKFRKLLQFYFKHLDKFDIFLVPMANPDGVAYMYARSNPMETVIWNKNVSPQSACPGVCLDRNFDVAWNGSRAVSSCSQQYPGPMPFSEQETRAIRDVFHRYSHKIIAYIHVHAGSHSPEDGFKGDAVLYPKGFTEVQSEDDRYIDLRGDLDEVMKNASFKVYSVATDTLANWYGKVSGSSVDFASSVYGIRYALELVMQPLKEDVYIDDIDGREQNQALNEVWKRVIDVVFENVHKTIKKQENNEDDTKRKKKKR